MTSGKPARQRVGEIRPSQLLHSFGIGAILDLPNLSVMVMGLEDWPESYTSEIGEARLLAAVQAQLGSSVHSLRGAPVPPEGSGDNPLDASALIGVPVATFPRWMVCPHCRLLAPRDGGLFQLKTDPYRPDQTKYVHESCSRAGRAPTVLPARFLAACEQGHLDDFPWHYFVHKGPSACDGALKLRERGVSGEAVDISIECDGCKAWRTLADAFGERGLEHMPRCRGRHPHLRDYDTTGCSQQLRAILLGASNSWFGVTLSALAVPEAVDPLPARIEANWVLLEKVTSREVLAAFRAIGQLHAFVGVSDDDLWTAIERHRTGTVTLVAETNLKAPEWRKFTAPSTVPPLPDFQLRAVPVPASYSGVLSQVVLVEKLREVSACVGFTRIGAPGDVADAGEIPIDRIAPLSRKPPTWVPAAEVRGEGIFLAFDEARIADWCAQPAVVTYEQHLLQAHVRWRRTRQLPDPQAGFPGARYALLHTFAHALMRELALSCGYTMASLRERLYALAPTADDGPMAGVLIYTAAPDSEGTLGGLVSLGEPQTLAGHIAAALRSMEICASDPLCAEHTLPMQPQTLHGGACHACMFVPETSCERGNHYLDRSLLVPTVVRSDLAFFTP